MLNIPCRRTKPQELAIIDLHRKPWVYSPATPWSCLYENRRTIGSMNYRRLRTRQSGAGHRYWLDTILRRGRICASCTTCACALHSRLWIARRRRPHEWAWHIRLWSRQIAHALRHMSLWPVLETHCDTTHTACAIWFTVYATAIIHDTNGLELRWLSLLTLNNRR